MSVAAAIDCARQIVTDADAIVITAGAGMGVDSGLPDFRGNQGFWKSYPIAKRLGLSFTDLANPAHFYENPRLAWAFYGHRLNLYRETQPHSGFQELLAVGERKPGGYFVYTSNVDGQFQAAGFDASCIVECHGSIHRLQCTSCQGELTWSADRCRIEIDMKVFLATGTLPNCAECGAIARPNILMFGDPWWVSNATDAQVQRFERWWEEITEKQTRIAVIELGAGLAVPTVRLFSERLASDPKASLVRINPRDAEVPVGHVSIPLGAAEGLSLILS